MLYYTSAHAISGKGMDLKRQNGLYFYLEIKKKKLRFKEHASRGNAFYKKF